MPGSGPTRLTRELLPSFATVSESFWTALDGSVPLSPRFGLALLSSDASRRLLVRSRSC
jgi:hypothetical protein